MTRMGTWTSASRQNQATDDTVDIENNRRHYFDTELNRHVSHVMQGDYYVTSRKDVVLTTVLGSCIAACIRDPLRGYGGMNHFLLPGNGPSNGIDEEGMANLSVRYGSFAMEQLINDLLSRGSLRGQLEVKVFGGGNVVKELSGIGHRNADFIEKYLHTEGLTVSSSHLRGSHARKIQYFPDSGVVRMCELGGRSVRSVIEKEQSWNFKMNVEKETGTVELFD